MTSSNNTDLSLHQRNAQRLIQQGKSPAEVAAYLDSMGVPRKKEVTIERDPGQRWEDQAKSFLGSALNSLTFGFADEAIGTLTGIVTNKTTNEAIDAYRASLQQAQQMEPGYATGGAVTGAIGSGLMTGGAGAGAGLMGRMGAGALVGGMGAGMQAAGDNTTDTAAGRVQSGMLPAVVGGALGGAIPFGGAITKGIIRPIGAKVNWVSKLPGVGSASEQADALFRKALERDGIPLDDLIDGARRAAVQGKPVSVADLGGENLKGLMAAAAAVPGKAKQGLTESVGTRQAGQRGRMLDDARAGMKLGLENVYALKEKLLAQRSRDAVPLYQAAYAKSVDIDGAMQRALDNPELERAYTLGKSIAAIEGVELPPLYVVQDGQKIWSPQLPVQALDYMKRGLNKRIEAGVRSKAGVDRTAAHHLRNRLEGILESVDKQVPEYGMARGFWKGETEAVEALELGRSFNKMNPDAVAMTYGKMSTVEKEMARTGYLESVRDAMGRNTAREPDIAKTVFGSPNAIGRIKVLFGDAADDMIDAIKTEQAISKTAAKLQGSRTEVLARETGDMDAGAEALGAVISLNPGSMVRALGKSVAGRARTGWTEEVSDELAKRFQINGAMTGGDAHDVLAMLNLMKRQGRPKAPGIGPLPGLLGQGIGRLGN